MNTIMKTGNDYIPTVGETGKRRLGASSIHLNLAIMSSLTLL